MRKHIHQYEERKYVSYDANMERARWSDHNSARVA